MAVDGNGNLYIADPYNQRIRKVSTDGTISTVAGNGSYGFSGDGATATAAKLNLPSSVAVDGLGNIYLADQYNQRIRKVTPDGIISTVAGNGSAGFSGDGGAAIAASLFNPTGVAVDGSGNLYIADQYNNRIRKVGPDGLISKVAGTGSTTFSGDGGAATVASLYIPYEMALDKIGNLYIADFGNQRIRQVTPSGTISTVAGTGSGGFSGDGGRANKASLYGPSGVALDGSGNLYIADEDNHRIRRVTPGGTISTVAGNGSQNFGGDGGAAIAASLNNPTGLAVDTLDNLYIADQSNNRIRKVDASGNISTVVGNGSASFSGDQGAATAASLNGPTGVAIGKSGDLYIADPYNQRIRKVNASGIISTVAGNGVRGFSGDGGAATAASLNNPIGVAFDRSGNLYIADENNGRIRKVDASGIISTVAGNCNYGFSGDGGAATAASLDNPGGVALDRSGNLYIADTGNRRIRRVSAECLDMFTLKIGIWSDPGVWSCGRVPVSTDLVRLNHPITLPENYLGQAQQIIYSTSGSLLFGASSTLKLGMN